MAGGAKNVCKDSTCGTRTFHQSGYCKAHRPKPTFQVTATLKPTEITFPLFKTPGSLSNTLTEALTAGGLHVLSLSVREGLPIGAREISGHIQPLSGRVQAIIDLLETYDDSNGLEYECNEALTQLQSLLTDVKQAEGAA